MLTENWYEEKDEISIELCLRLSFDFEPWYAMAV